MQTDIQNFLRDYEEEWSERVPTIDQLSAKLEAAGLAQGAVSYIYGRSGRMFGKWETYAD